MERIWKGTNKILNLQVTISDVIASYSGWHWHPTIYYRFFWWVVVAIAILDLWLRWFFTDCTMVNHHETNIYFFFIFLQASSRAAKSQIQAIFPSPLGQSQVIPLGGEKSRNPTGFQWPCRVQREPNRSLHQVNGWEFPNPETEKVAWHLKLRDIAHGKIIHGMKISMAPENHWLEEEFPKCRIDIPEIWWLEC